MGISRKLNIIMRRPGGLLLLLLTFIGYSKCQVSIEGNCRYACNQDGSCMTDWTGSFKNGVTSASCFPPRFGGCLGKVDGCKDCNQVCGGGSSGGGSSSSGGLAIRDCERKGLCKCQITSSGKECVGIPQENVPSSSGSSGGSKSDGDCRYQCKSNGGCQVFSSSGSGSCFSQAFGGSCSGTPRGCQDCNRAINC